MNSLKKGEGVPLLNFEGGPGILLLNFEGVQVPGPRVRRSHFYTMPLHSLFLLYAKLRTIKI